MIERVLYVSRATPGVGAAEVYDIIRAAHAGNRGRRLTGALIFIDGWFAQALEGPAAELADRLARIRRDPRHGALELRTHARALCPAFPAQPMALRTRACLDPGVLAAFGYRPGFPVGDFPSDVLLEFMIEACRRMWRPHRSAGTARP